MKAGVSVKENGLGVGDQGPLALKISGSDIGDQTSAVQASAICVMARLMSVRERP